MPIKPFVAVTALFLFLNKTLAQEIVLEYNYNQNIELTNQGWEQIRKEGYEQAIQLFTQAINLYDGNTDSYSGLSTAYFKIKEYEGAIHAVESAIELSPKEADLYYLSGNINTRRQEFELSIIDYTKALTLNPTSEVQIDLSNCYFNRGNAFLLVEKYNAAIRDFDKSIERRPIANAYHNKAIAYRHLKRKQEACDNFFTAIKLGSKKSQPYLDQYCEGISTKRIDNQTKTFATGTTKQLIEDTIVVKLFYTRNWLLTTKENGVVWREANFRVSDQKFVGPFIDYYPNGKPIVKGQYDSLGEKSGLFERYYENGNLYSIGTYVNDIQTGKWEYYYENSNIKEKIVFEGESFYVEEYHDLNGKVMVKDGSGKWVKFFANSLTESYKLIAPFENRKRSGKWKMTNFRGETALIESYENGQFKSGKSGTPGSLKKHNHSQFSSQLFYPISFIGTEKFNYANGVYRSDYPFLVHLPQKKENPMEGIYLEATDTTTAEIFEVVEVQPIPPGGMSGFYKYVGMNLRYPAEARKYGIEGRVFVQFVVDIDGSLTDIKIIKGIGAGCDKEVERIIYSAPKWIPGKQKGRPVKVRMILPITFNLG